jgi:hypothetical protein
MYTCTCEKCSEHRVTDLMTGLLASGHIVGRKEFLEHGHLEKMKQSLNDTMATGTSDNDTSSQQGSDSSSYSVFPVVRLTLGFVLDTTCLMPQGTDYQVLLFASTVAHNLPTF